MIHFRYNKIHSWFFFFRNSPNFETLFSISLPYAAQYLQVKFKLKIVRKERVNEREEYKWSIERRGVRGREEERDMQRGAKEIGWQTDRQRMKL